MVGVEAGKTFYHAGFFLLFPMIVIVIVIVIINCACCMHLCFYMYSAWSPCRYVLYICVSIRVCVCLCASIDIYISPMSANWKYDIYTNIHI